MLRQLFVCFALSAVLPCAAQTEKAPPSPAPAPEVSAPPAPADRILDQTATWSPDERKVATAELNAAAAQLRFAVYLVNLNAAPDEQPADLARRYLTAWTGAADRAVILTGPGLKPPVHIECVGESLGSAPPEQIAAMRAAAQSAAAKAGSGLPASMAAARSLITQMDAFRAGAPLGPSTAPAAADEEPAKGDHKILFLALGCICVVLLLAASFFMKRRQTSALIFPPVQARRRFSAPHSGGNNAMIQYGAAPAEAPRAGSPEIK